MIKTVQDDPALLLRLQAQQVGREHDMAAVRQLRGIKEKTESQGV